MFNDIGIDVEKYIKLNKTTFVETRAEAQKLTEIRGYYYVIFNKKKEQIGYGIPR
jgi:hypothetical protein